VRAGDAEVAAGAGGLDLTDRVGGALGRTGGLVRGRMPVDGARAGYPGLAARETGCNCSLKGRTVPVDLALLTSTCSVNCPAHC
jgi:hypothetical protein